MLQRPVQRHPSCLLDTTRRKPSNTCVMEPRRMEPRRMDVGFPPATGGPALPPPGASLFGCMRPTEGGNARGGDEAKLNSCSTKHRLLCQVPSFKHRQWLSNV